jgi:tripartite-type tricarboxylate transporter receptor subunit TctC
VAATPNVLAINPKIPADSVEQLAKLVASAPGKYNYAQPATGSTPHLSGELFRMHFNLDLPAIPFAGSAPAIASTIGGHTAMVFTSLPPAVGVIRDKQLKALAVTSAKRSATIPDVPTMAEAGLSRQEAETWVGIWAPARTPNPIVQFLNREIAKAFATPEVKAKLEAIAFEPVVNSPEEFTEQISAELKKWAENISKSGISQIK